MKHQLDLHFSLALGLTHFRKRHQQDHFPQLPQLPLPLFQVLGCSLPKPNPFFNKKTPHLSAVPSHRVVSGRRRKVCQPFKRLKRNEKNWLGHRCQRMQRCCRDLSFNSCGARKRQKNGASRHPVVWWRWSTVTPLSRSQIEWAAIKNRLF